MKFFKDLINKLKMNLIEKYLADFIDKFKTKNAVIYSVIAMVLIGAKAALESTFGQELFPVDENGWIEWFLFVFALVVGAHTPQKDNNGSTKSE